MSPVISSGFFWRQKEKTVSRNMNGENENAFMSPCPISLPWFAMMVSTKSNVALFPRFVTCLLP